MDLRLEVCGKLYPVSKQINGERAGEKIKKERGNKLRKNEREKEERASKKKTQKERANK